MAKKIFLLPYILPLLLLASCAQEDQAAIPCVPVAVSGGTVVTLRWVQYDVFLSDYLHGGRYTREEMESDFMCDNGITDIATARQIISTQPRPVSWVVPCPPVPVPGPNPISFDWTAYATYLKSPNQNPYAEFSMITAFMCDNLAIPDRDTAKRIIQEFPFDPTVEWPLP